MQLVKGRLIEQILRLMRPLRNAAQVTVRWLALVRSVSHCGTLSAARMPNIVGICIRC